MLDLTKFKVYIVGGYVRDRLLQRECKDHDFVVVGATPQIMFANGFQRVGADFPVFLSPAGDEYALARTERKTSVGYNGFETDFNPSITLEEDLERRDLTVNAMAREVLGWNDEGHAKLSDEIIDPFNGQKDLKDGLLRHVSDAFADDPVRVLRVARFAARYGFIVAQSTVKLMQQLVDNGELDHLVPERVWTEFEKAMGEEEPSKFFWALQSCGAYDLLFGELQSSIIYTGHAVRRAVVLELDTVQRMSITLSGVPFDKIEPLLKRFKAPTEVFRATRKMRLLLEITRQSSVTPTEVLDTLNKMDAFNNGTLIKTLFSTSLTCHTDRSEKVGLLLVALKAAAKVSFATLSDEQRDTLKGKAIGEAIDNLRLAKIIDVWRW